MKYIDSLTKLGKMGKAVGEQLSRKAKKPLAHYKAIERAEKVMDAHEITPKRVPMNVPDIKFTEEQKDEAQRVVEELFHSFQHFPFISYFRSISKYTSKIH